MRALANQSKQDLSRLPSIARGEVGTHLVPIRVASADTLRGFGRLVGDFASAAVDLVPWPALGRRPVVPGTGVGGGIVEGNFTFERHGGILFAENHAVKRRYITGWFGDPASASEEDREVDRRRIFTHEANYHPDGGQIFFPRDGAPFMALLAPPGDDVRPEDFVAFSFDGTAGVHLAPGVWHQPVFPLVDRAVFDDRQGAVHACVSIDFVEEFGVYLEVSLQPG